MAAVAEPKQQEEPTDFFSSLQKPGGFALPKFSNKSKPMFNDDFEPGLGEEVA